MNTVLFDLDGTLTDPAEGITNSVAHALRRFGLEPPPREELLDFIGPPLADSFQKNFGFYAAQARQAIDFYREYFRGRGIFENRVYPGVPGLLSGLRESGKKLLLATSKPEPFAEEILDHFGIAKYFDLCVGASMDETLVRKADVVRLALARSGAEPSASVMVGDRSHDVLGALANGVAPIGVLYGYGSSAELADAGASMLAPTVAELERLLMSL